MNLKLNLNSMYNTETFNYQKDKMNKLFLKE